jgi:hypothetical protein
VPARATCSADAQGGGREHRDQRSPGLYVAGGGAIIAVLATAGPDHMNPAQKHHADKEASCTQW